eukprot:326515-Pyramimonas_sp.AAC.1
MSEPYVLALQLVMIDPAMTAPPTLRMKSDCAIRCAGTLKSPTMSHGRRSEFTQAPRRRYLLRLGPDRPTPEKT